MQVHNITQGTDQWRAHRAKYLNASDAPAMMACSPNMSRTDLVRQLALGIERDFSDYVQNHILDKGHLFEKLARPMAEKIMGEELAPLVGTSGKYGASFDGQTMLGERSWEHKRLNAALREAMFEGCTGADLPLCYQVQMEHQAMVAGDTEQILFTASEWDDDGNIIEARHCWYTPNPALRSQIVAGWAQLEADVAAYVQPEPKPAPVVGKTPDNLPALLIQVTGAVTASNLPEYKAHALEVFKGINRTLSTDQDFATAESTVKWCADVESRLAAAKEHALSQTATIDELFRTIDDISAEARRTRLELDKLVKARKEEIRGEMVAGGIAALREHIAQLNAAMPVNYMPQVPADFAGAIKGKRTVESLRSAVNDELARAKIAASEIANRIHANVKTLQASGLVVHDAAALVLKAPDDLAAIITNRVTAERERQEAERERIRKEEADRADREAREKLAAEERAAQAAITQAAKAETLHPAVAADLGGMVREQHAEAVATLDAQQVIGTAQRAAASPQPAVSDTANLLIGAINTQLGYIVNAAFLAELGFHPARIEGARRFYRDSDMPLIGRAIAEHTLRVTQLQVA
ncbi:Heme peroxidase [Acidovorax sp. HMWF018]|uniref:YqaJ viral recombinase family protein n=1 Tax=Acidovorax sp. HMWF018 TaxID=2056855 RepID=UPI000D3DCA05|nr:YqaJ viral recombinase family protein [Acidovorax sp. HMWF018]PTT41484.1 Heme peroxidase [Acidovorax sp. HMWF018]